MTELTHYLTADGYDPFQAWLDATKAKDRQAAQQSDIEQAKAFLADHKRRTRHEKS
ncbi:MAG: hypothetical protein ACTJG4_04040 [Vreelandella alkaliphila]|uniref:hypothetical protein n=1 Tax=Halomonadaceae TaxID=28256 RepID=UPI0018694772|nr:MULTISPECIES: hypothetical protein [unclassified Halomonas]